MKDSDVLTASAARSMSEDELKDKILALHKEQFNTRFQKAAGQFEKTATIRKTRRNIARVKTILREKQKGAS